ncbi:MFS transporter [Naasia lichenicola]|uniref:MFS transporter n=1 Tax=Naasia lichenicola TaxID=2565933 RepID=A0A4S4FFN2_9MICO|nr:MFS transporter [Naasia lichenicola]THG28542.1 MFS transporter [Naasia lichenicola]
MTNAAPEFRWRSIALPALLPTLLFSTGEGAILPIIPVVATDLGATLAVAGLIAAMVMIGELVGDVPSGWIVARVGERVAMLGASSLALLGLVLSVFAPNPFLLGLGIFFAGLATAVFALARHAFMTSFVPIAYRARALSTLGGTFRLGYLVGPFLSAAVIHITGDTKAAFWIFVVGCLGAAITLLLLPDPETTFGAARLSRAQTNTGGTATVAPTEARMGLFSTLAARRDVLLRLGVGSAIVAALRASRQVILPLWAVSIGLADTQTALIIGIASIVDFGLFYAGGQIMDRFGRLWTALPSMIGLGVGHIGLALTSGLPGREGWFIVLAVFLSLANGIGAGMLMTMGADLAPRRDPAPFLGAWRFTNDAGAAAAPVAVAGLTALISLPFAAATLGVLGLVGAGVLLRYVPRFASGRTT